MWVTPESEEFSILRKILEGKGFQTTLLKRLEKLLKSCSKDAADQSGPIIIVFQVIFNQFGLKF